jgi:hypothetical protein
VRRGNGGAPQARPHVAVASASSVLATYVPLLVAAWITLPSLTERYGGVRLPFLSDWNLMFMFVVTMPALVAYLVNDQRVLTAALGRTIRDEILELQASDAVTLCESCSWRR